VEWVRDDRMVIEAFDDYWGERGNVDRVVFRPITEDGTRLLSFEAGEIDLFHGQVTPGEAPRLEATDGITVTRSTGLGPISPESIYFADDIPRYPYDPERARALLTEAGLGDGVAVRLHTNENPVRIQIAKILQFEAAQVGIDIDVTIEEFGAFIDRILGPDKDFDLFILGWSGNVDPDYATYGLFKTGGDNNDIAYGNAEIDVLLDLGRTLPPGSDESIAAYQQIQRLLMSDVPFASATFQDPHLVTKTR